MTETTTKRTYWAMSVFNSRTMWLNFLSILVGVLSMTEVVTIIPREHMTTYTIILGALNMMLRKVTVRPVAFIAPGDVSRVTVDKIDPPAKKMSD